MKNKKKSSAITAGIGYTIGNILIKGISFLSIPIFTRVMTTADYGIYNSFVAYVSIMMIFEGLVIHTSLKNALYDFKGDFHKYSSSTLLMVIINTLVITALTLVFHKPISAFVDFNLYIVIMLILNAFGMAIVTYYNALISLEYRYKEYIILSLIYSVSSIGLSLVLIKLLPKNKVYVGRIVGTVLPIVIIAIVVIIKMFHTSRPRYNKEYWQYATRLSVPLIPHSLSQIILAQFDRIMIKKIISDQMAGLYSFAYNIAIIPQVIASSLDTAWMPWFYEQMEKKDYARIKKMSSLYILLFSFMVVGLILVSPEIIMIMSHKDYWKSKYVVIPIVLGMYFAFLYTIPSGVEYYYKKTKIISLATMLAAALNVILNLIFIPRYGYIAAAYTTLVCYILYFVFHMVVAKRVAKMQHFNVKYILACIAGVSFLSILAFVFINMMFVRFAICLILIAAALIVVFKNKKQILEIAKK